MKIITAIEPGKLPEIQFQTDEGQPAEVAQSVFYLRTLLGFRFPLELANAIIKADGPEVSGRTVENWEQGRNDPRYGAMKAMQQLLADHEKRASRKAKASK